MLSLQLDAEDDFCRRQFHADCFVAGKELKFP